MRNKKSEITACFIIASAYAVFYLLGIGCPIRFFTGISCAGCGMTRAWRSAVSLDFESAFAYHPLFLLPFVYAVLYPFRKRIDMDIVLYVFLIAFIAVYIERLIDPNDDVVYFAPAKGAVFTALRKIGEVLKWLLKKGNL